MNSDSVNMVSRLGEGHMPCSFFLSEPQLKTTVGPMATTVDHRLVLLQNALASTRRASLAHRLTLELRITSPSIQHVLSIYFASKA